ncbi:MAG: hypothetical protein LBI64_04480 [Coriobacteriales bacterium]|nr:hypothetical protein [Coriobacteriales bacterium]
MSEPDDNKVASEHDNSIIPSESDPVVSAESESSSDRVYASEPEPILELEPIPEPEPTPSPELPPSPFKPISEKQIAKARRSRLALIVALIILIGAFVGLGYLGYRIVIDKPAVAEHEVKPVIELSGVNLVEPSAPNELSIEKTDIPELVGLYGLTIDEIAAKLGTNWVLTKTDIVDDSSNPAIRQLATFSFTVQSMASGAQPMSADVSLPTTSLYISLDSDGRCIDIYYSCDLLLLDYPMSAFDDLLATSAFVDGVLESAGIVPKDFTYAAPDHEASIEYDNSNSANRKILKQSTIFSGRIEGEGAPVAWTLTLTYDYGAGVDTPAEYKRASRILYLKIA